MRAGAGQQIRKTRSQINREEQAFHIATVRMLHLTLLPGTVVFHIPNGGKRSPAEGAILKAMGVKKGFPDLGLIRGGRIFCLEAKSEDGELSKDQIDCRAELAAAGVTVAEVRTTDDVLAALRAWNIPTRIKGETA